MNTVSGTPRPLIAHSYLLTAICTLGLLMAVAAVPAAAQQHNLAAPRQHEPAAPQKHDPALGTLTIGAGYSWLSTNLPSNPSDLNGGYANFGIGLLPRLSFVLHSSDYFGSIGGNTVNSQTFTAGPALTVFKRGRLSAFGYLFQGDQHSQAAGSALNQYILMAGGGFHWKLRPHLLLTVIPGEYDYSAHTGANTYLNAFGLTLVIPHH